MDRPNYIERVLSVAKAYDHDTMPINVKDLEGCYDGLKELLATLRAIAAPDTPCVEMQALAEAALNEVN